MNLKEGTEVAPGIVVYDDVIDNCSELINFASSTPEKWRESRISGTSTEEGTVNKNIRNTKILDIPGVYSNDIIWFEVAQKIWQYANQYALDFDIGFSNMEYLQLLHYSTGEGFYKPHADAGPGLNRIFSALLYLNDVQEGGETYFNKFDIAIAPKIGRLAIFPANYIYMHEARPPKSNDKFAIVTWFNPII